MKLKKIASLMLAGVMAVSMLAGCNTASDNGNNGGEGEGEGEGTASGYSSVLADNLSADAKKDYITYQNNASDVAALEDALGNLGSVVTGVASVVPHLVEVEDVTVLPGLDLVVADFIDNAELYDNDIEKWDLNFVNRRNQDTNVVVKEATMYAIDGTVDANKAVKQVAADLDGVLSQLPEESDPALSDNTHFTYDYTVSVSVVNKPVAVIDGYHASVNFIAVTVTRVPTAA